mmetsp:Transcript_130847/g.226425  ORF Transcript_130847/g.226425 Transcript_130847/m.226425 type:complete len:241 (-) Transcript_130847:667-1389(-)
MRVAEQMLSVSRSVGNPRSEITGGAAGAVSFTALGVPPNTPHGTNRWRTSGSWRANWNGADRPEYADPDCGGSCSFDDIGVVAGDKQVQLTWSCPFCPPFMSTSVTHSCTLAFTPPPGIVNRTAPNPQLTCVRASKEMRHAATTGASNVSLLPHWGLAERAAAAAVSCSHPDSWHPSMVCSRTRTVGHVPLLSMPYAPLASMMVISTFCSEKSKALWSSGAFARHNAAHSSGPCCAHRTS